jgi:hypothetical protein
VKTSAFFRLRLFLIIWLTVISANVKSQNLQSWYFGLGANATYAPLQGLNTALNHYQNIRFDAANVSPENETWINNMSEVNVMIGPSISFGYMFKPEFNLEFRYLDRFNSRTSQVINSAGSVITRNFDFKSRSFGIGMSKLFAAGKSDYIVGSTFNMTWFSIDGTNIPDPNPTSDTNYGATVFLKYIFNFSEKSPFAIVINPYVQYHFTPIDFYRFNQVINPVTFRNVDSGDLKGARSYFGLELQLNYFVFTRFNREELE